MTIKLTKLIIAGAIASTVAAAGVVNAAPITVPLNREMVLNSVQVGCTGVGQSRLQPRWTKYPVRIEFAGVSGDYLANVVAVVTRVDGAAMFEVGCEGPWLLFELPPGRYKVEGRVMGSNAQPQTATFTSPATGQARVVLHFPGA